MDASSGLSRVLERVWGINYKPWTESTVRISRPDGFIVAEKRIRVEEEGPWIVYWTRRMGASTRRIARLIEGVAGGRAAFMGLKDSEAVAYQYIFVRDPKDPPRMIETSEFSAWLVGRRRKRPVLGGHGWNNFRLELEVTSGDPVEVCSSFKDLVVPGFYGPQRFGVERPNTHLLGLFTGIPAPGHIVREYMYNYPFQKPYGGGYEERGLSRVDETRDPYDILNYTPSSLARDALQSYIWNRMLSHILLSGEGIEAYGRVASALCPGNKKAWVAPLPSRRLLLESNRWASLLKHMLIEEGIESRILPSKAPMRPLAVEACRSSCRVVGDRVTVWLTLPRGIYASIAVRSVAYVEWIN